MDFPLENMNFVCKCLLWWYRLGLILTSNAWSICCKQFLLESFFIQLDKCKTEPYFLMIFQSNTLVCLIISVFCKSCEPICEPEITPVSYRLENLQKSKQNNLTFSVQFTNLTKRGNRHCRALEILKKIWICLVFIWLYAQPSPLVSQ